MSSVRVPSKAIIDISSHELMITGSPGRESREFKP